MAICATCKRELANLVAYESFIIKCAPTEPHQDPKQNPPQYTVSSIGPYCEPCWNDLVEEASKDNPCWRGAIARREQEKADILNKMSPQEQDEYIMKKAAEEAAANKPIFDKATG